MLNSINLDDKSYEDILTEAISQIPLYSEEWTNFNHSDPGITMLQNFSAFALLQQNTINQITDPVRRSLLRLIGFEAAPLRPAHVFAACEGGEAIALPAQWKGRVGDLCFETEQPVLMEPWSVDAVYMKLPGEEFRDITFLLGRRIPADTAVFGTHPEAGAALYVGLTGTPRPGATAAFWLQAAGDPNRNPFRAEAPVQFASLRWQAYTASGWKTIPAQDETAAFLQSGAVRLTFPAEPLAVCGELPHPACAIRCVVDAASYDRAPRVQSFTGNLLELVQKETRAACFTFPGGEEAVVRSAMASYGNEFLCCREEAGGPYYAYRLWTGGATSGRFYTKEEEGGTVRFRFDRERFGFGPAAGEDAILCSFWDDDATYRRSLGTVYGFEGQEIDVDLMENILPESFALLAEIAGRDGSLTYRLVRPGGTDPDELCYRVLPAEGKVRILCPGLGACRLYLASCAVTAGREGNIRSQNTFEPLLPGSLPENVRLWNPSAGRGGQAQETLEEVRLRFAAAMRRPTTAVTAQDYEEIVKAVPGLCIRQVKAVRDEAENSVSIAVQPFSEEPYPALSPVYEEQILHWLEHRRLVSVRLRLLQPQYVPVDVKATIFIRNTHSDAREEIEAVLNRSLDFTASGRGFGETLSYHRLVRALEQLPCVESVFELFLIPQAKGDMMYSGHDIKLGDHSLCRPGRFSLELSTRAVRH